MLHPQGAQAKTWLALGSVAAALLGVLLQIALQDGADVELAWPPSRKSLPFLATLAAAFVVCTYKVRCQKSTEKEP